MSRDGELTSHLPLMKAPTPVMLLGGPWECRDDSAGFLASRISDDRGCRFLLGKNLLENERIRAFEPLLRSAAPTWV